MNRIIEIRKEKHLMRKDLAKRACMSESALGRRERWEVPLTEDEIERLIEILGCTYDELLGGNNNAK